MLKRFKRPSDYIRDEFTQGVRILTGRIFGYEFTLVLFLILIGDEVFDESENITVGELLLSFLEEHNFKHKVCEKVFNFAIQSIVDKKPLSRQLFLSSDDKDINTFSREVLTNSFLMSRENILNNFCAFYDDNIASKTIYN